MDRWYVCETKWRHEHVARENLRRQDFVTMLPTFVRERVVRRARVEVEQPLFLRYLFVMFDVEVARWRAVASTVGVVRIMGGDAERPIPLRDKAVAILREQCSQGPLREPEIEPTLIAVGRAARVLDGPLAGLVGEVIESNGARVKLLLRMLGRLQCVPMSPELVAAA